MFYLGILSFATIIGLEFAFAAFGKFAALREIRPIVNERVLSVSVNGVQMAFPANLLQALREMRDPIGHHSHPTDRFRVRITTTNSSLTLDLGRDSHNPNEFWVFYPGFHSTELNDVGRVFTDALE